MGSCCSAITLFTFHIYLGIFLAQGGSLPRLEWETILVLQQKRLKSLNLNQTLDVAPPSSSLATVGQVIRAWCWVSRLSPWFIPHLFVMHRLDFCTLRVYLVNKLYLYVCSEAVWDLWSTCLGHMDLLFGRKTETSHQVAISFHLYVLNVGTINVGFAVRPVLGFKPSWDWLARVLSRCLRVYSEAPSSLPMGSSFKKKLHTGLDHRTGSVAMAPLWHTGASHSSPGRAVATEAKLLSVFRLDCVHTCPYVYVCLPSSKPTCISVCSPKSVQNCWQVPIPLSGKSLHAYTVAWSPSCCARLASLKMWQVYSLLSATNAIYSTSP